MSNTHMYHDSCETLIPDFYDGMFDLILTSPPYNLGKEYESIQPFQDYLTWIESIIDMLVPKLAVTGSICWQSGNYVDSGEVYPLDIYFYPMFKKHGLLLRNRIIWWFGHGLHARNRFSGRYETILWFTREDYKFNLDAVRVPQKYPNKKHYKGDKKGQLSCNPLGKNPSDVWEITNVKNNHPEKTDHPAQYPLALAERCILAVTDEGNYVLDPFAGTGTTLIAAQKHNREAVGIEKEYEYIKMYDQRIKRTKE